MSDVQAGDREVIAGHAETMRRNVIANVEFSQDTRKMVRKLEESVQFLQNTVATQNEVMKNYQIQLAGLLQKQYSGGT